MKKLIIIFAILFSFSCKAQLLQQNDVLVIYALGQSNTGTDPSMGPLNIDSLPSYLKGTFSNVLIDTVINSALYFTPFISNGIGGGYFNQIIWRESQVYKWVIIVKRSSGGTKIEPPASYPSADMKNYMATLKPIIHDFADSTRCDIMYLYDQGETDAATLGAAVTFKTNFLNLMQFDIRPTYGLYPVFAKRIGNMQTDFPYIVPNLQAGQDSIKALYPSVYHYINTDSLPMKGEGIKTGLTYNGDFSHHREETAVKVGNMFADSIEYVFGKTKLDRIKPLLTKATINAAGTTMTLKFTEVLGEKSKPHPSNFVCGTKSFINIVISGDSVVLTPASLFYSGTVYTIGITKDGHMKVNLQDRSGNELSTVTAFPVVNNCTVSSPTFTTIYTSNFATLGDAGANIDKFWTAPNSGTATANSTSVTGVTACAKYDAVSGGTNRFYKWSTTGMNTSGKIYIIGFDIEVPRTMSLTGAPNSLYMKCDNLDHSAQFDFTKLIKRDKMTHVEYQFTEGTPTNDDFYFEFGCNSNSTVYIKNMTIRSN